MPDSVGPDLLADTKWADAARIPLAGDASGRRYERLCLGQERAILMVSDETRPFVDMARFLSRQGFSAPEIYAEVPGGLIIEDFGDGIFARIVEVEPGREQALYRAAAACLAELQNIAPPNLARMTPESLGAATDLAFTWYAKKGAPDQAVSDAFTDAFDRLDGVASVLVHRDFHAENLFWLGAREGKSQVGLIDFQDALIGHPAYDLVSLLADARRDLSAELADDMVKYFADLTGREVEALHYECALFGAQRNLRILGVFARLAAKDGKTGYLPLLPRVWRHLEVALAHPRLGGLRAALDGKLPTPDAAYLAMLQSQ